MLDSDQSVGPSGGARALVGSEPNNWVTELHRTDLPAADETPYKADNGKVPTCQL